MIKSALYGISLFIDWIVYSIVGISYDVFMLISQVNLNSIGSSVSGVIDRIKAVILVYILFTVAKKMVSFLLEPDTLTSGGSKLIKNIAISSVLLICINPVFSFFNELSFLIVGVPANYTFTSILADFGVVGGESDPGLIVRLLYDDAEMSKDEIGENLAKTTLSLFLHDNHGDSVLNDGESISSIVSKAPNVGNTILYEYPIISTILGGYLVYSILSAAIAVGVRVFKLLVLQVIAPVPILSIITDGIDGQSWKRYISTYTSVYISLFTRLISMHLIVVVITKTLMGTSDVLNQFGGGLTSNFAFALLIAAAFTAVKEFGKLIEDATGIKVSGGGGEIKGFAKGVGKIFGAATGAVAGGVAGGAAAIAAGRNIGSVGAFLGGAGKGLAAGFRGDKISDSIRNIKTSNDSIVQKQIDIGKAGYSKYLGAKSKSFKGAFLGDLPSKKAELEKLEKAFKKDESKYTYAGTTEKIEFGGSWEEFANKLVDNDEKVSEHQTDIENYKSQLDALYKVKAEYVAAKKPTATLDGQIAAVTKDISDAKNKLNARIRTVRGDAKTEYEDGQKAKGITSLKDEIKNLEGAIK